MERVGVVEVLAGGASGGRAVALLVHARVPTVRQDVHVLLLLVPTIMLELRLGVVRNLVVVHLAHPIVLVLEVDDRHGLLHVHRLLASQLGWLLVLFSYVSAVRDDLHM